MENETSKEEVVEEIDQLIEEGEALKKPKPLPWYKQFTVHAEELWFWRVGVILALILSVVSLLK